MATPSISEVLEHTTKLKTKKERIEHLRKYDSKPLRDVLKAALDPSIKWLLPEGTPPYKENDDNINTHHVLMQETRKFYLFLEGYAPPTVKQMQRENLFIQLLESVHPADAKLMVAVKDKKIPIKTITKELVAETFPGLL